MGKQRMIRNLAWAAAIVAILALSSCNAPGEPAAGAIAESEAPVAEAGTSQPVAPVKLPAAPEAPSAPEAPEAQPAPALPSPTLAASDDEDRACRSDSDCAMKDAGSCCGYRPVCVNKDTPTFPEKVKAACAKDGRVGICGFPAIDGCQCVAGKCKGVPMMENSVLLQ